MRRLKILFTIFSLTILLGGFNQDAFAQYSGFVTLDRDIFPLPWGELADYGGTATPGADSVFPVHPTAITGNIDTEEETLGNGDVIIHIEITDLDFNQNPNAIDTIAQDVGDQNYGPLKIYVHRDLDKMVIAYAGGSSPNTTGVLDVNDNGNTASIRQLGAITETGTNTGKFKLDLAIRYTDGPASANCPQGTVSYVGTNGIRSGDELNRFDESSGPNKFCILDRDKITVEYTDPSDTTFSERTVDDTAVFNLRTPQFIPKDIQTQVGENVLISLEDLDLNLDSEVREFYDLDVIEWDFGPNTTLGDLGNNMFQFNPHPTVLLETSPNSGLFQAKIEIPSKISGNIVDIGPTEIEFSDWSAPNGGEYVGDVDEDATLFVNINSEIMRTGKVRDLEGQPIQMQDNYAIGKINIPQDVSIYFPNNNQLRERINSSGLQGISTFDDEFVEYKKKVVLRQSTTIKISNNEQFASVFGSDSKSIKPFYVTRDGETTRIDDDFVAQKINEILVTCEIVQKEFCSMSHEQIQEDISNKIGSHTIREEFVISKEFQDRYEKSNSLRYVTFEDNSFAYKPDSNYHFASMIPSYDIGNIVLPTVEAREPSITINGNQQASVSFINGFTLGHGYTWSTEWDWEYNDIAVFQSDASAFVGFGLGFRIPVESTVKVAGDQLEYAVNVFDADSNYYRTAGIDESQIFSGEEFVLELGPEAEANVYLMGFPVEEFSLQEYVLGDRLPTGRDLEPPLGSQEAQEFISAEVPCNLIPHICHKYELVNLSLQPGIRGDLKGEKVTMDATVKGTTNSKSLSFSNEANSVKHSFNQNSADYKIELDDVTYHSKIIVTPFLHGVIEIDFLSSFIGDDATLLDHTVDLFEIELIDIDFEKHEETVGIHNLSIHDDNARISDSGPLDDNSSGDESDLGERSGVGMLSDGTQVLIWTTPPTADKPMEITVQFVGKGHINYDMLVQQNGQGSMNDIGRHSHGGTSSHETKPLRTSDPVDITITFKGYGDVPLEQRTGPIWEKVVFSKVIPEFGVVSGVILIVAMVTILSVLFLVNKRANYSVFSQNM